MNLDLQGNGLEDNSRTSQIGDNKTSIRPINLGDGVRE